MVSRHLLQRDSTLGGLCITPPFSPLYATDTSRASLVLTLIPSKSAVSIPPFIPIFSYVLLMTKRGDDLDMAVMMKRPGPHYELHSQISYTICRYVTSVCTFPQYFRARPTYHMLTQSPRTRSETFNAPLRAFLFGKFARIRLTTLLR